MNIGTAKWFKNQKGCSFISDDQKDEDFVKYKTLHKGQSVIFDLMLQKVLVDHRQSTLALYK